MGRLGPALTLYPIWDDRCPLGVRRFADSGYDVVLVFDAQDVQLAVWKNGGALYFDRAGNVTASAPYSLCGDAQFRHHPGGDHSWGDG